MRPSSSNADSISVSSAAFAAAVQVLRQGGVVGFPTETSYGLAADITDEKALARVYRLKERQPGKPLLTLIAESAQLAMLAAEVPSLFERLMQVFWPGPLTLLFPALPGLSTSLTGSTGTVGVRISSHPVARKLVATFGLPLTATSANRSGMPAACSADEVRAQLGAGLDYLLDCGRTVGGPGSTIVGLEEGRLRLVRPGAIPFEDVVAVDRN